MRKYVHKPKYSAGNSCYEWRLAVMGLNWNFWPIPYHFAGSDLKGKKRNKHTQPLGLLTIKGIHNKFNKAWKN